MTLRFWVMIGLLAGTLGLLGAGCVSVPRAPLGQGHDFGRNNPRLCLAMGDSITQGEGGKTSYPALLSRMLRKTVVNRGDGGSHSLDGMRSINRFLTLHKPGYLLILYGANDVLHDRSCDAYIENLRFMLRAARQNKTLPILATMTPMTKGHKGHASTVTRYNEKVRELAKSEGVTLCDLELHFMAAGAAWGAFLQADGLHPDEQGMRLIAQSFYDLMR
ncbi:MAG: SGNH/GDSL hydrolase family protein [bacterium]